MSLLVLMIVAAVLAAILLVMTVINLRVLGSAATPVEGGSELVSVCIPARNEAANLEACVRGLLASRSAAIEVLVYDDQSTDATPDILAKLCEEDPRVRNVSTHALPEGWNGKQHACWRMAGAARGAWLLFTDADVRFTPDAIGVARAEASRRNADLISGFPRQITGTLTESLVVPMIFFILLSYLPFLRMRRTNDPASSAGCGQFLFISRRAYESTGGHATFRDSMHDGIRMPREVRRKGMHSDLADITGVASCRMYYGAASTWRGFAKNAYEGLSSPVLLVVLTLIHLVGYVMPWLVLGMEAWTVWSGGGPALASGTLAWAGAAIVLSGVHRAVIARWSQTPMWTAMTHPLAVLLVTAVQWYSFWLHLSGQRAWKGRTHGPAAAAGA